MISQFVKDSITWRGFLVVGIKEKLEFECSLKTHVDRGESFPNYDK